MTRRRKVVFALIAVGLSVVAVLGVLLALDLYVNQKFMDSGGVNVWGYRGPTVGAKQPGEQRVIVVGGSTAFGYGVRWAESFPAQLEILLNEQKPAGDGGRKTSVVNLAGNNEGAYSFKFTLEDYEFLNYDVVLFYTGYNDLAFLKNFQVSNLQVARRQSAIYRWTGYHPMLPVVMREKAMVIRYDGRLDDAYRGKPTVFRPNLAQRSAASALEAAAGLAESLDKITGEAQEQPGGDGALQLADLMAVECGAYAGYCNEVYLAVKAVLDRGKRAIVVTQPFISDAHTEQQRSLHEYLRKRFAGSTSLSFVDLGPSVDLLDPALAPDGMHLSAEGNSIIARRLVDTVANVLHGAPAAPVTDFDGTASDRVLTEDVPLDPAGFERSPGTLRTAEIDSREMAWIPPGRFMMGSPLSEPGRDGDEPQHVVTMRTGFWIDTHEVTNAAFQRFVREETRWSKARVRAGVAVGVYLTDWEGTHVPKGREDHPLTGVPWAAAVAFCSWAGKRLPTEPEWEYAARAGTTTAYWWGDTFDAARAKSDGIGTAAAGHDARVNAWGLADMAGNVWEWTSSQYQPYPYRADDGREDPAHREGGRRVLRGGSWLMVPEYSRSADRFKLAPLIGSQYVGFRCAASQ